MKEFWKAMTDLVRVVTKWVEYELKRQKEEKS